MLISGVVMALLLKQNSEADLREFSDMKTLKGSLVIS